MATIRTINDLAIEDLEAMDCIASLLPSLDGDEKTWRKNVRATMRLFLMERHLPLQAIALDSRKRVAAVENRQEKLEQELQVMHEKMLERVATVDRRLTSIEGGIGALKWLVTLPAFVTLIGLVALWTRQHYGL